MAKAPGAAADFDGSGQVWFKIKDIGPTFSGGQAVWDMSRKCPIASSLYTMSLKSARNIHIQHPLRTA